MTSYDDTKNELKKIFPKEDLSKYAIYYSGTSAGQVYDIVYTATTTNDIQQQRINEQEEKDRYITVNILNDIITGATKIHLSANIKSYVDVMSCIINSNKPFYFNTEIKENANCEKWGSVLLKVDKLQRMLKESNGIPLFYVVLSNESTCYIFHLDKINWDNVEKRSIREKMVQMRKESPFIDVECYHIPLSMAYRTIPCAKYFLKYKLMKELKEL